MPVQSAILLPEPGSVIDGSRVSAVWFRGYAMSDDGQPITRVDVSADGGATWAAADIVERESGNQGSGTAPNPKTPPQVGSRAWSWVKWQLPLQVRAVGMIEPNHVGLLASSALLRPSTHLMPRPRAVLCAVRTV
eukprot:GHRQ01032812.1.p1 GENE.GHRQ01032812.1~~GHRQ01032812.1.p1  ORF type:complete len:135 (+),score=20.04 GHRQ01032812.1:66-470(+)